MLRQTFPRCKFTFAVSLAAWVGLSTGQLPAQSIKQKAATPEADIDFTTEVAPILRDKCIECHDASLQMAGLRLDSRQAMLDAGVIELGDSANSLLIQRLQEREHGILMPPSGRLAKASIDALKSWIDAGAHWTSSTTLADTSASLQSHRRPAVFDFVRKNDLASLRRILSDEQIPNTVDNYGATPLMYASMLSSVDVVKLLLDHGADPNATDKNGLTPLMYAAGAEVEKTKTLLARGANVDVQSKLGRTVLLMASAFAGNTPVVTALLHNGADVRYSDRRKWTAVVLAARTGDTELVRTLLDAGGDVNGGNAKRLSPGTPLMQAAWASDVPTTRLLLSRGAADDQRSLDASLISAATHGCLDVVDLLLESGANPNANIVTNYIPESPILAACGSDAQNISLVKRLMANDADLKKKDSRGETALSLALQRGNTDIASLLRERMSTLSPTAKATHQDKLADKLPDQQAATTRDIRKLTQKSVSLLQQCGPVFFANSGCVACHQQTATSLVVQAGRDRGLLVDEKIERQQIKLTAFDLGRKRSNFLQRMKSGGTTHRLGYLMWGLAASGYPSDDITDAMYHELAGLQLQNGSWVSDAHRPPTEYSPFTATAVSMRAIQEYSPPGLRSATKQRIARATKWLSEAKANANAEQAFRLLGLHWGQADRSTINQAGARLLEQQSADGGWSQLPHLPSDAYATGLTLYALAESGTLNANDPAYQKGVQFLVRTAKPDGSWHVVSRTFAFQPYFESGFPHGTDQWISAAATGWSTLALLKTLPKTADSRPSKISTSF